MTMKKFFKACFCVVAIFALFTGCGGKTSSPSSDNSLQKVLDAKQFVLGLDIGFPPMGFVDQTGEIKGFDIDVAQAVCDRLGVKLIKRGIDWDTKEDNLNDGTIDCIWNGLSVTPARAETMNFSEPYMKNELRVVVSVSSDAKGIQDLAGKTLGVQSGATAQDALKASEIASKISIVTFEDNLTLLNQLEQGTIDAALVDSVVAYYYIFSSQEQFFILSNSLGEEKYAIGFRKGDKKLRDEVQTLLNEMKADGTLGNISKKWFGSDITIVK
jgi:ABC-type amino acid transport substrate-binding protein